MTSRFSSILSDRYLLSRNVVCGGIVVALLFVYLVAGLYTELWLNSIKHIPATLLEDFGHYERALSTTLRGEDPYEIRKIGPAYLYPPPALLAVEVFSYIQPFSLKVAVYTVTNILLLVVMIWGIARYYGYSLSQTWYWFVLGLGFAPFFELLHIGQINQITQFGIFLLFWGEALFPIWASTGLTLAILTKVSPLLFIGYLIVLKRYSVLFMTGVLILVFGFLAALRYGITPFVTYVDVFQDLLRTIPLGTNAQSLMAKLAISNEIWFRNALLYMPGGVASWLLELFSILTQNYRSISLFLTIYILSILVVSGILTWLGSLNREPFFIITVFGMIFSSNVMWYHHYVFLLLPVFVWIGWQKLKFATVFWCFLGLLIIQIDRSIPPYGLLSHVWAHLSILLLFWQVVHLHRQKQAPRAVAYASLG
ncbi:MAG: DUF2029 domain-containing protein [Chloroflexi bacterium]|nr:MAG: DUF2029 domain-containing protein [Chloroflexota bacterium]